MKHSGSNRTGGQLRRPLGSLGGARRPRGRGRARSPRAGSCGARWAASAAPGDREAGDALDRHGLAAAAPAGQPRRRPATARQGTRSIATGWQLRRPLGSLDGARRPRGRGRARSPRAGSCGARWAASAAPGDREAGDALDRHGLAAAAPAGQPRRRPATARQGTRSIATGWQLRRPLGSLGGARRPRGRGRARSPRAGSCGDRWAGRACPRLRSRGTPAAPEGRQSLPSTAIEGHASGSRAVAGGALPWRSARSPASRSPSSIETSQRSPAEPCRGSRTATPAISTALLRFPLRAARPVYWLLQSIAPVRISTAPSAAIYCASKKALCDLAALRRARSARSLRSSSRPGCGGQRLTSRGTPGCGGGEAPPCGSPAPRSTADASRRCSR